MEYDPVCKDVDRLILKRYFLYQFDISTVKTEMRILSKKLLEMYG